MAKMKKAQEKLLNGLIRKFRRLQKKLAVLHDKTGYEDLGHGILSLQSAEHTTEEVLEHTGLGGEIRHEPNAMAHRQAARWHKTVNGLRTQGGKFFETYPSEDMETALKALEIADGSLQEVAERYE